MAMNNNPDAIIDEFLQGQPRSETWQSLKETLAARLVDARAERDACAPDDPRRALLEKKVRELAEQVRVLAEEEAVTRFVEDSVRASLARPRMPGDEGEDDEAGYY